MKTKLQDAIRITIAVLLLSAGVAYAGVWTGPTDTFPAGNVDAPINVGNSTQQKIGALRLGDTALIAGTSITASSSIWTKGSLGVDGGGYFGGNVGIGKSSSGQSLLMVANSKPDDKSFFRIEGYDPDANHGPNISSYRARGTSAVPANVVSGDDLGGATFSGYFSGAWRPAALIDVLVDGSPTVNNIPTRIDIHTYNGAVAEDRITIRSDGRVGIGNQSPTAKLDVNGTAKMTGFQLGTTATAGQVLTTNASGVGTWQNAVSGATGITSLTQSTGITLTPNPITTTGTVAVNTAVIQNRVTGTCPSGQAIRAVAADGTVTCESIPVAGGSGTYSPGSIVGGGVEDIYSKAYYYDCEPSGSVYGLATLDATHVRALVVCPSDSTKRKVWYEVRHCDIGSETTAPHTVNSILCIKN